MRSLVTKYGGCSLIVAFAGAWMAGLTFAALGADDYSQWAHASTITLNTTASGANVATTQAGFPVLVRLTSANTVFSFAQAQPAGQDIRFATSGGIHIPYQIERWDNANQVAEIWVKADVNGNNNTQLLMYWGNAGAADSSNGPSVFSNGFVGVWHLNETGNTNANGYADATGSFPLTGVGMAAGDETNAVIGRGQNFGSTNVSNLPAVTGKYLTAAAGPSEAGKGITAMVWTQLTGTASQQYVFNQGGTGNTRWDLGINTSNPFPFEFDINDHTAGNFTTDVTAIDGNWHLWAVTYDTLTPANFALAGAVAEGPAGTFTDQTAAANNVTANDMILIRATPAVNDAYYFGNATTFKALGLHVGTLGVGVWTIAWEYWNGAWVPLNGVSDGTKNGVNGSLTLSGSVSFTQPLDWATTSVDGITAYWIRARVSAFTSVTTLPLGTQAFCGPTVTLWKDGSPVATSVLWTRPGRSGEIDIATRSDHTNLFKGIVDEPSLAVGVRSADWINLCYQSQKLGANWITFTSVTTAAPSITTSPSNLTVNSGQTATFTVVATGGGLAYQWQRSPDGTTWTNVAAGTGGASSAYSFTAAYPADNGAQFRCTVTNSKGAATSGTATLTVTCNAPSISTQPTPATQTVLVGGAVSYSVSATGTNVPFTYQWQQSKNGGATWTAAGGAGATSQSFTSSALTSSDNNSQFHCIVTSACGTSATSNAVSVTVTTQPPVITVQPAAATTVNVGGSLSLTVVATNATAYQWKQGGTAIAGATAATYSKNPVALADAGSYTVVVKNTQDSVESQPAVVTVLVPIKAMFTVSQTIAQVPATITFTDQSTGPFTKRLWYFGDGGVDTSNNSNPQHAYNSSGVFSAELVLLNGAVRADSMTVSITIFKDNPVAITGKYVSTGKAEITFANYALVPLGPTFPFADSVKLWYQSGAALPVSPAAPAAQCGVYLLSDMQKATPPFKADVLVSLAAGDTSAGFMTQVHWNTGLAASYWSAFSPGNGTIVAMTDTSTPVNTARPGGQWLGGDSVQFSISNLLNLDTSSVDSVIVWFGTSTTDTVPNYADPAQTWRFKLASVYASGRDSVVVQNPQFNTGIQKLLNCYAIVKGKDKKESSPVRAQYYSGANRPSNPILLTAVAQSASSILLTWNPVGGVSNIRIWYQTGAAVTVNTATFASPPYVSVDVPLVSNTQLVVTGLLAQTHYYFGAQVFQGGQWSYVTDSSSANATTFQPGGKLDTNSVKITSLTFDTVTNEIHVSWTVNNNLPDTLEIGISYSLSAYPDTADPSADTSIHQLVQVKSGSDSTTIKPQPFLFSSDTSHSTRYYVALWESRLNGTPADPTAASEAVVASPFYNWQPATLFTKVPGDTHALFNGNIVIIANAPTLGDVSNTPDTIRYASIGPANLNGFVPVSVPFYFSHLDQSAPFKIEFKLLPAAFTSGLANVRIYQQGSNGLWYVDRTSTADSSGYAWTIMANSDFMNPHDPLMALIDTMPVTVTLGLHSDTVGENANLSDTLHISDNCANVIAKYYYASGDNSEAGVYSNMLSSTSALCTVSVAGALYVSPYTGYRGLVVASDGVHYDTLNVSRQVMRSNSDVVPTGAQTWVPLRVTAGLADGVMKDILDSSMHNPAWTYDNTQLRLFRWQSDKWVEYSDQTAGIFSMVPGIVVWAKSRQSISVNFGNGITPSLKNAYPISLAPGEFTDFALPFKFDIRIGDIIDSTGPLGDSLQFHSWPGEGVSTGQLVTNKLFIEDMGVPALADKGTVISSQDLAGAYTVYNPLTVPVTLKVAPIPKALSGYVAKKRMAAKASAATGWALSVVPRLSDGSPLTSVLCGYTQAKGAAMSYYPVPPSFSQEHVCVYDNTGKKLYGDALSHATAGGGCTYLLAFVNDGQEQSRISYHVEALTALPQGFLAKALNEQTGIYDDFSVKDAAVTVAAGGRAYRLLVVGSQSYLAKMAIIMKTGTLQLIGTSPNPFGRMVRIRYNIPGGGVSSAKFCIYDMRGRIVWQTTTNEEGFQGIREITWDGRSLDNRRVAAGMYVVRMEALDENKKTSGIFEKRMTYLP
jgi:PKD repeat protein